VESGVEEGAYVASVDDTQLVAALRAGDEQAFMQLVERYGPSMLRVAMLFVQTRAVAEEVVQDTWVGVLDGIGRFEGRSSFKTWLFRILTNTAKTRGARESRSTPVSFLSGSDLESGATSVDPDRFLPDGERWAGWWASSPIRFDETTIWIAPAPSATARLLQESEESPKQRSGDCCTLKSDRRVHVRRESPPTGDPVATS
jgi:RNA polymerase sigma-70 factor (ECF subfamily)